MVLNFPINVIIIEFAYPGIRSVNFNNDILSIGTGNGAIYFYDLRGQKFLDLDCGHAMSLNAGKGWLVCSFFSLKMLVLRPIIPESLLFQIYILKIIK